MKPIIIEFYPHSFELDSQSYTQTPVKDVLYSQSVRKKHVERSPTINKKDVSKCQQYLSIRISYPLWNLLSCLPDVNC